MGVEFEVIKHMATAGLLKFAEPCVTECETEDEGCDACLQDSRARVCWAEGQERWTPVMQRANHQREAQWSEFSKWIGQMNKYYQWDDYNGLTASTESGSLAPEGTVAVYIVIVVKRAEYADLTNNNSSYIVGQT